MLNLLCEQLVVYQSNFLEFILNKWQKKSFSAVMLSIGCISEHLCCFQKAGEYSHPKLFSWGFKTGPLSGSF